MNNTRQVKNIGCESATTSKGVPFIRLITSDGKYNIWGRNKLLQDKAKATVDQMIEIEVTAPNDKGYLDIVNINTSEELQKGLSSITEAVTESIIKPQFEDRSLSMYVAYAKDIFICLYSAQQIKLQDPKLSDEQIAMAEEFYTMEQFAKKSAEIVNLLKGGIK